MLLSQAYFLFQQSLSKGAYQIAHLEVNRCEKADIYLAWDLAVFMIGFEADKHVVAGFSLLQPALSVLDALLNSGKELFEWPMTEFYLSCLYGVTVHCK